MLKWFWWKKWWNDVKIKPQVWGTCTELSFFFVLHLIIWEHRHAKPQCFTYPTNCLKDFWVSITNGASAATRKFSQQRPNLCWEETVKQNCRNQQLSSFWETNSWMQWPHCIEGVFIVEYCGVRFHKQMYEWQNSAFIWIVTYLSLDIYKLASKNYIDQCMPRLASKVLEKLMNKGKLKNLFQTCNTKGFCSITVLCPSSYFSLSTVFNSFCEIPKGETNLLGKNYE